MEPVTWVPDAGQWLESYASLGGAAATVPTTGIVSTQDLTPGNDFFALANIEGGTDWNDALLAEHRDRIFYLN